jgi:hypothetical protein
MKNKNLLSEIHRMKELAGIISENKETLNEVDTSLLGGIAKNLYLGISKNKPNNPLDINGTPLKNINGDIITYVKKASMDYQNAATGMNKMAANGKAVQLGKGQGTEVSIFYMNNMINAMGFVRKEEAESALKNILSKYPNQITGKVVENKMEYDWAKNYAPRYSIQINLKNDKEIAKNQSARPATQQQATPQEQPLQQAAE